jgi:tetratricopeptide (TPR) repeat protein
MTDLLKDSANRQNIKIYDTWYDAVLNQYMAANEKLYLKQKYDTAAFYKLICHLQEVAFKQDSLDCLPDRKGRVRPSFRKNHGEVLHAIRPNIYYGGTWHVHKGNYSSAYDYFDAYIEGARQPLYAAYNYDKTDSLLTTAAYWATYCAYRTKDARRMLKHVPLAERDSAYIEYGMQNEAMAYQILGDTVRYVGMLRKGFDRFPQHPYFFPRLADYYSSKGRQDSVLVIANRGVEINDSNTLFLMGRSMALLNLERYDECIETSQRIIELNDTLPEPYLNIATCYLNKALVVESENEPRKNRRRLEQLYQQARPYMEDYRRLQPDAKQRWGVGLYRIYLHLNMGKQFEEIDRLMRK